MENLRFKNKIDLKIVVDENLNSDLIEIPAMILQPIVENSIKHGFKKTRNTQYLIEIDVKRYTDFYSIDISDNGIGFSNRKSENNEKEDLSRGLIIVRERLRLINHSLNTEDYFLIMDRFSNNEIIGTIVKMKFPIKSFKH